MILYLMIFGQKYEFFIVWVKKMGLNIGEVINGMILIRNIWLKKKLGYDFCLLKKDKEF